MGTATLEPKMEVEVWMRILHPDRKLSRGVARAILGLGFEERDALRMRELSAKARAGTLTAEENSEMDDVERVGAMLSTLKSKARLALKSPLRSA